ncbi:unnamed protein product, partial [Prorocentrum cordatum]
AAQGAAHRAAANNASWPTSPESSAERVRGLCEVLEVASKHQSCSPGRTPPPPPPSHAPTAAPTPEGSDCDLQELGASRHGAAPGSTGGPAEAKLTEGAASKVVGVSDEVVLWVPACAT